MSPDRLVSRLAILLTTVLVFAAPAGAQEEPGKKPKEKDLKRQSEAQPGSNTDPNAPPKPKLTGEQKWLLQVKELLQAGDEEWMVLEPRIAAVTRLQREVTAGRDPKGPRPPRTDRPSPSPNDPPTPPVVAQSRALSAALFDPSLPASEIKARVAAVRDARAQARQNLARAQEELRELLTYRQEATLIIMGVLE